MTLKITATIEYGEGEPEPSPARLAETFARAAGWVLRNRTRIEREAARAIAGAEEGVEMKPGDEVVIGGVVRGLVRAIRSREELAEIAPLLSVQVDRRIRAGGVIRVALVVVPRDRLPWLLIETADGWRTVAGESITVTLLSEARPC